MSRRTRLFALAAAFAPALLFAQSSATIQLLILGSGSITFPNGGKCATHLQHAGATWRVHHARGDANERLGHIGLGRLQGHHFRHEPLHDDDADR